LREFDRRRGRTVCDCFRSQTAANMRTASCNNIGPMAVNAATAALPEKAACN
jgi:hypothetical protein